MMKQSKCCFNCGANMYCEMACKEMCDNGECDEVGIYCANWCGEEELDETFVKFSNGKLRYDLLPYFALDIIVEVLGYGAKKYSEDNWKRGGKIAIKDYKAAIGRHYSRLMQGEYYDSGKDGSGLPHLAHIATNCMFIMELIEN